MTGPSDSNWASQSHDVSAVSAAGIRGWWRRPAAPLLAVAAAMLAIHLATSDAITARSVTAVEWLWPLTLVLFAHQKLSRRHLIDLLHPLQIRIVTLPSVIRSGEPSH